jgi:hypothetical protein
MASFPLSPVNGQIWTNPLGTGYVYDSTRTAWLINSQTVVGQTGLQGPTGVQGQTGFYDRWLGDVYPGRGLGV